MIIGAGYDTSADIWSTACMVGVLSPVSVAILNSFLFKAFELATGDFLFEPKKGGHYGKDDDHIALIIGTYLNVIKITPILKNMNVLELLGRVPSSIFKEGQHWRSFFHKVHICSAFDLFGPLC